MGWTQFTMHEPIKEWFKKQWDYTDSDYEVLDSALVHRQTLYGAVRQKSTGEVFCAVYLIRWSRGYEYNFSYKDMTEFAGPCESACPPKIFKLLTPLTDENDPNGWARTWRKKVEVLHETRNKMKKGYVIKLEEPVHFTNGSAYSMFLKKGRKYYTAIKAKEMFKGGDEKYITDVYVRFDPTKYGKYELIKN